MSRSLECTRCNVVRSDRATSPPTLTLPIEAAPARLPNKSYSASPVSSSRPPTAMRPFSREAYPRSTWCELGQQHRRPPAQRDTLTGTALELDLELPHEAALAIGQGVLLTFFRQSNDRCPEPFLAPFETQLISEARTASDLRPGQLQGPDPIDLKGQGLGHPPGVILISSAETGFNGPARPRSHAADHDGRRPASALGPCLSDVADQFDRGTKARHSPPRPRSYRRCLDGSGCQGASRHAARTSTAPRV